MKSLLTLIIALVLVAGCSRGHDFRSRLRGITAGTSKSQVRETLGAPIHIFTRTNYWGTWLVGTSEWWQYSDDSHCQITFGERGGVQFLYAHHDRIVPPQ